MLLYMYNSVNAHESFISFSSLTIMLNNHSMKCYLIRCRSTNQIYNLEFKSVGFYHGYDKIWQLGRTSDFVVEFTHITLNIKSLWNNYCLQYNTYRTGLKWRYIKINCLLIRRIRVFGYIPSMHFKSVNTCISSDQG